MKNQNVLIDIKVMALIKEMLFGNTTTGLSLSPIIDDLCQPGDNRDEIAVRVLLAWKGKSIMPDNPVRYALCKSPAGKPVVMRIEAVKCSLIHDNVIVKMSPSQIAKDGSIGDCKCKDEKESTLPINLFEELDEELPSVEKLKDFFAHCNSKNDEE